MRILVTGATGFIGGVLANQLAARGDRVRALVRATSRTHALARLGAELAPGDVSDPASLQRAVEGCEGVVHLAGAVKALSKAELFRANAGGTRNVVEACARTGCRLVYVSSLAAAGPSLGGRPRREEDPPAPVSSYGESKLAGEAAVRAAAGRCPPPSFAHRWSTARATRSSCRSSSGWRGSGSSSGRDPLRSASAWCTWRTCVAA